MINETVLTRPHSSRLVTMLALIVLAVSMLLSGCASEVSGEDVEIASVDEELSCGSKFARYCVDYSVLAGDLGCPTGVAGPCRALKKICDRVAGKCGVPKKCVRHSECPDHLFCNAHGQCQRDFR